MRSYTQLTREQRYQISALLKMGHNHTEIAGLLHVHKSTVGRDINRNRGRRGYRPRQADRKACNRRKTPRRIVRIQWDEVDALLRQDWSPEQVSGWLKTQERRSISQKQDLVLNTKGILGEIRKQGLATPPNLRQAFTQINSIFIASSWGILSETKTYNTIATKEDVQFLRHIRNAGAHDGLFNFDLPLKHPAKWRDKEILPSLKGTPVFPGFLKDGDPIFLLIDITNRYYTPISIQGYVPYSP